MSVGQLAGVGFKFLSEKIEKTELIKIIDSSIQRLCNEYTEVETGIQDTAKRVTASREVSLVVMLDVVQQQQTLSDLHPKKVATKWCRDYFSAYKCPSAIWVDQYDASCGERSHPSAEGLTEMEHDETAPSTGAEKWPTMFFRSYGSPPSDRPTHWPTIMSIIDRAPRSTKEKARTAWPHDKPLYSYDSTLHTTFFIFSPDPNVYVCLVCQGQRRPLKDSSVAEFLLALNDHLAHNLLVTAKVQQSE